MKCIKIYMKEKNERQQRSLLQSADMYISFDENY